MAKLQVERDVCEKQADYWQNEAANFAVAIDKAHAALDVCMAALRTYDLIDTQAAAAIAQAEAARN